MGKPSAPGPVDDAALGPRQLFVTSGGRFVRAAAVVMIVVFAVFLAAQFTGLSISLP